MTSGIKITSKEMRYISLFESITGANVKDCIVNEEQSRVIFVVKEGEIGMAIGRGGRNIHTLERMTGKKHEIIVCASDENSANKVIVFCLRALTSAPPTVLPSGNIDWKSLDESIVRNRDDHVFFGDHIFNREFAIVVDDLRTSLVAVFISNFD